MKQMKKMLRRAAAALLAAALLLPGSALPSLAAALDAENRGQVGQVKDLLEGKKGPYDILIFFHTPSENMDAEEQAELAQKDARALLEASGGDVISWESFYITNAIHAKIKTKDLVYRLARLPEVKEITWDGEVERVEPVEDEDESDRMLFFSNNIYKPDERDIEWGVLLVQADRVWKDFNITGEGVTVGIIDGGANYELPALKHAFQPGGFKDFVDKRSTPSHTSADDHGTHVAGTIVGREGDKLNRIGVAPGAKFITARAMGPDGGKQSDLIAAAQWMLQQKPDVINNSWGGPNDNDPWFQDIIKAWVEAGIVPVFAAGNTAEEVPGKGTISNPANYKDVLAVAAVDRDKQIGRFSNKGPSAFEDANRLHKPEISAPGVQVRSVDSNGHYVSWNGTSMAAPHVTGVVALIRQAAKDAGVSDQYDSVDEIRKLLIETAEPLSDSDYPDSPNYAYGYGLVNAYDAVAKIKQMGRVEITGEVLQDGSDSANPTVTFDMGDESYLGRDLQVKVKVTDDVSIVNASLQYTPNGGQPVEKKMTLVDGVQKNGTYAFTIPSVELSKGNLELSVSVTDYGQNTITEKKTINVQGGQTLPWTENFEAAETGKTPVGFLMDGSWNISEKKGSHEPEPVGENNTKYVGIDAGQNGFARRVDSYLYLPPIDLSNVSKTDHPSLSVDMFNSFTGISTAQIQVSTKGGAEGSWDTLHQVTIRPDFGIEKQRWENHTFSLEKYAGENQPVQIRFYFYGHDGDENNGMGWYLDNLAVATNEGKAPSQVENLTSAIDQEGLHIIFDANEETDVVNYTLERKEQGNGDFAAIATIQQEFDKFQFIYPNTEADHPESHYHVVYLDETAQKGKTYEYRVSAQDFSGNTGAASETHTVEYKGYEPRQYHDFEQGDSGFQSKAVTGSINDWERGKPEMPAGELSYNQKLAWDGLLKNQSTVWGTKLNAQISPEQDSCLLMPEFEVQQGDHLYFDSYSAIHYVSPAVHFNVDIQVKGEDTWTTIVSRQDIMAGEGLNEWKKVESDLSNYAGKAVSIRFHSRVDGNPDIGNYELGWYIDDVLVGAKQNQMQAAKVQAEKNEADLQAQGYYQIESMAAQFAQQGLGQIVAKESSKATTGIPFKARVTVKESGRSTESSEIDGTYSIKQAATVNDTYTLVFEAYGYKTQEKTVTAAGMAGTDPKKVNVGKVLMEPAAEASFSGSVTDTDGNKLTGVSVRLVGDERMPLMTSNNQGVYDCKKTYEGSYTLRFFKDGYLPREEKIELKPDESKVIDEVQLTPVSGLQEKTVDYGYSISKGSDGKYLTVQFTSGPKGAAVRFQSPYIGGRLKSADIFFVQNDSYSGNHAQVGVLSYNKSGRLVELSPFRDYEVKKPNDWNTVEFSEHIVQTDAPIYVAVYYDKDKVNFSDCMGVYYDINAEEKAKAYSFIYDGAFTPTASLAPAGAYAMRAKWYHAPDAKVNPESDIGQGSGGVQPPLIDDDSAFVFDANTHTIIKYQGKNTAVVIPSTIKGVEVKCIGSNAFSGGGKSAEERLTSIVISDGIEIIEEGAFRNNSLNKIKLPSTLKTISANAFAYQFGVKSMDLLIPDGVKVIGKGAFRNVAASLKVTMNGVLQVEDEAFAENKELEVHAEQLQSIGEKAFGYRSDGKLPYAKVFTKTSGLTSKEQQYLINPAKVVVKHRNARDSEDVTLGQKVFYGKDISDFSSSTPIDRFYTIGQTVTIEPYDFKIEGETYSTMDEAVTIQLEAENEVAFYYTTLEPQLRKIVAGDTEIVGYGLPNSMIALSIGGKEYTGSTNVDGYFAISVADLQENAKIDVKVNGKSTDSQTVTGRPSGDYIIEGNVLVRYLGRGGDLTLPTAGSKGTIDRIAPFAFKGAKLGNVILPTALNQIGAGAFMETGIKSFGWDVEDIDKNCKLQVIEEYAFRDNALTSVVLPELTHAIRTGAFENNKIAELKLGKYSAHVGDRAFKNNQIKRVEMAETAEELGEEAFMDNQIEDLIIKMRTDGEESLVHIPARAFANNKMRSVKLPITIKEVHATAFQNNTTETRFIVESDAKEIIPTSGYDVRRSDGTLLTWSPDSNGGGGGAGGGSIGSILPETPVEYGNVTVAPVKHGVVSVTPKESKPGDKVTITVKPDTGYKPGSMIVKDENGNIIPVYITGKGTYTFIMPEGKVTITSMVGKKKANTVNFSDVIKNSWYEDGVLWAVENGIASGISDKEFAPNFNCTRAQMVTFLWRAAGAPKAENNNLSFQDVSEHAYYKEAVLWAVENNITTGTSADSFAPNAVCTRGQTVTFLHRLAGKEAAQSTGSFADVDQTAYYADAVQWAVDRGITTGTDNATFSPNDTCTRAQIVTFLYRYLGK